MRTITLTFLVIISLALLFVNYSKPIIKDDTIHYLKWVEWYESKNPILKSYIPQRYMIPVIILSKIGLDMYKLILTLLLIILSCILSAKLHNSIEAGFHTFILIMIFSRIYQYHIDGIVLAQQLFEVGLMFWLIFFISSSTAFFMIMFIPFLSRLHSLRELKYIPKNLLSLNVWKVNYVFLQFIRFCPIQLLGFAFYVRKKLEWKNMSFLFVLISFFVVDIIFSISSNGARITPTWTLLLIIWVSGLFVKLRVDNLIVTYILMMLERLLIGVIVGWV